MNGKSYKKQWPYTVYWIRCNGIECMSKNTGENMDEFDTACENMHQSNVILWRVVNKVLIWAAVMEWSLTKTSSKRVLWSTAVPTSLAVYTIYQ